MQLSSDTPAKFHFVCNICGAHNLFDIKAAHREVASCNKCGSTPRFRGLMMALSQRLFGEIIEIKDFPLSPNVKGLGMSEWEGYASRLSSKFDFINTHFHAEPFLDITQSSARVYQEMDFVICTEVFEHIMRPLTTAFANLFNLLRPGGVLIFSAPYFSNEITIEHYPNMFEYEAIKFKGEWIVVNRTSEGVFEVFDEPVFHGGPGAVLEMRLFCENDLLSGLRDAGFTDIEIHSTPVPAVGYYWPAVKERAPKFNETALGYIMSCKRPLSL